MFKVAYKSSFKKDLKRLKKRSINDFRLLEKFIEKLTEKGVKGIPVKHKPHALTGNYKNHFEAHVKPNLLLIWKEYNDTLILELVRTGSHSDLF
jgi:mRNA interferase YafQ